MYGNPVFRTQRNRVKPLNSQVITAANLWPASSMNAVGDEAIVPPFTSPQPTGFTNATSLRVVVPSSIVVNEVFCYVTSIATVATWITDVSYIVSATPCTIGGTTIVSIKPGDYVTFSLTAYENPGNVTVTVNNQFFKATGQPVIDTFVVTWS
jgi:hypothetical protein